MATLMHERVENYYQYPDDRGHFGRFGGLFVAETLMGPLRELREAYEKYGDDSDFQKIIGKENRGQMPEQAPNNPLQFTAGITDRLREMRSMMDAADRSVA